MDKKYIDADFLKQKISREWDMQDLYLPVHFFDVVDDLPAADVQEVRHGRWITSEIATNCGLTSGSCCHSEYYIGELQNLEGDNDFVMYCPNCGARMDGEEGGKP